MNGTLRHVLPIPSAQKTKNAPSAAGAGAAGGDYGNLAGDAGRSIVYFVAVLADGGQPAARPYGGKAAKTEARGEQGGSAPPASGQF